jgi:hypothetical protein
MATFGFGGHSTLNDDLLAYYLMETAAGSGPGTDETSNGYHLGNTLVTIHANGVIGNCSYFANGPHLKENGPPYIDAFNCKHLSVSSWVKSVNKSGHQTLFSKGDQWRTHTQSTTGKVWFHVTAGGVLGFSGFSSVSVTDNTWNHVVTTYDGVDMKVYINGLLNLDASHPVGGDITVASDEILLLGALRYAGSPPATGSFLRFSWQDEVGLWSRALTQPEVTDLFNGGAGLSYRDFVSTLGHEFLVDTGVDTVSLLGHKFSVSNSLSSLLGHQFSIPGILSSSLGHQFGIYPKKLILDLSKVTRRFLK